MDDHRRDEPDFDDEPIWLAASNAVTSLLMAVAFLMLIPWRQFYEHTLLWEDQQGMAFFFGSITILNAVSLVIRAKAVDDANAKWGDLQNRYVSMCMSTLSNTFFSGGLALWCAREDLGIPRVICYLITAGGTFGHTALFAQRWQNSKSRGDGLVTTIYGILSVVLTLTFVFNQDLF